MSNLLSIPFKKTYAIDVKEAARQYLEEHSGTHPDAFRADLSRWQELRKDGVGGVVHVNQINSMLSYHAQLLSILTKLPNDIRLDIAYAHAFSPNAVPVTLKNLAFERAAILFNLAALYSQLAASEDRSHIDGIKRAISYYQQAAGTLSFLRTSALPKLVLSPDDEEIPVDLSKPCVYALEWLMLAQAQECFWQKAKLDNFKNALIARLAGNTASLYQQATKTIREASPSIRHIFPSQWLSHIESKQHHFEAVAQYRKSMDELEASSYGFEIARLSVAKTEAKQAYDIARRGKVSDTVMHDIQSLLDAVQKNLTRAERDNDLIYHHDVPAAAALPPIPHAAIAQVTVPPALTNPSSILGGNNMILGQLLGWGAQEAINIYNDRKANLLKEQVLDVTRALKEQSDEILQSLNLPSSLEALERPIGLPPSLLKKAEEVRLEKGPAKIERSFDDLQRLAKHDTEILNEAMDILDHEASEDEAARREMPLDRPPSYECNTDLVEKELRYRRIIEDAAASDETIRQKWDEWEESIVELTWDEADLEASVPSSIPSSSPTSPSSEGAETHKHARELRILLESLDWLHRDQQQVARRAQTLAKADDIQPRILKAAAGFERLVEVEPAMFEDVSDEELAKYDKFVTEIKDFEQKQVDLLTAIKSRNELFLQSRKDDPSVKEREHALQMLDLSYHKYREITHNMEEGIKFYNDLAGIFIQFKESCKTWSNQRRQEIHSLTRSMQSMSLREKEAPSPSKTRVKQTPSRSSSTPSRKQTPGKSSLGLPALTSDEWGFEDLTIPPGPATNR